LRQKCINHNYLVEQRRICESGFITEHYKEKKRAQARTLGLGSGEGDLIIKKSFREGLPGPSRGLPED